MCGGPATATRQAANTPDTFSERLTRRVVIDLDARLGQLLAETGCHLRPIVEPFISADDDEHRWDGGVGTQERQLLRACERAIVRSFPRSTRILHTRQRTRTLGRRDVRQHRHSSPMTARWQTGTVACGGEEIYYEVSGDDDLPAIMLTHGAGGTHAAWFQQVPTLAANGFRVITWDCRGFGNSTFTSGVFGSAAAVADMAAVLDATGTPGAHLVGQSMGGWWVTAFTVAHPARTHSLTLSNTVGGLWTTALLDYFREWMTKAAANFGAEQRIGAHSAISPTFVERDPARAFLYQELNTFHTPPMAAVGAALTGDAVAHKDLDATGVPVLVITSTDDALFPPHLVIDSAQRLANASIVEVAGAGHSTYFERPDLYNDALIAFIEKAGR